MKSFLHDDFLLESDLAVELYHRYAKDQPIIDYHCHLSPEQIANNHRFRSLTELWLEGDHYKWRAMRANGVAERYCTGDATDWQKFQAWAATVPQILRNPLFHWTHLELRRAFAIEALLSPRSARAIYEECNTLLQDKRFTATGLLKQFNVTVLCTTDDPTDSLEAHEALAKRVEPDTRVYPTWRPDCALAIDDPTSFNTWADRLEQVSGVAIGNFAGLLQALQKRHDFFHERGCRLSDHGLEHLYAEPWTDTEVASSFADLRAGRTLQQGEVLRLKSALLHRLALLDHARRWVQQFHLGALRNANSRLQMRVGRDAGADSIGDFDQARPLARFLDRLDKTNELTKTILYNINPADNELIATMIGNFQDGSVPGKLQYGAAWWFLDQKEGIEAQMRAISNMGLLARFIGMVTDSRSFLSYCRHEYFRRVLCNLLGEDVRRGLLPADRELLGSLVRNVSFENARDYFGFWQGQTGKTA